MAFSTSLIGFLPTYTSIGVLASLFLTVCRVIQGFAIGGEFTLSITYLIEHAPNNKKGLYGSCTMLGTFIGLFLGSISVAILNFFFSETQLTEYAWRIPFIPSLLLGFLGLIMRSKLPETPEFTEMIGQGQTLENPVKVVIQKSYVKLLIAVGVVCLGACSFSIWFIWLPSYLKIYSKLSSGHILLINSSNLFIITAAIPLIGYLSDKVGIRIILASAALGTIALVLPLLYFMSSLSIYSVWLSQLGLAILASMAYGVVPITLFKLFPAKIRCSGISISYNLANMVFGGTIPLLASLILAHTSNIMYQGIVVIIASLIILGLLLVIEEPFVN
jgi:MHS family proline/betaine transporter-like MFS transporter